MQGLPSRHGTGISEGPKLSSCYRVVADSSGPPLEPGKRFVQTEAAPDIQGWATRRGLLGEWSESLNFAVGDGKELQNSLFSTRYKDLFCAGREIWVDLWRKRNLVAEEEEGGGGRCSSVILPHVLCTSTAGGLLPQLERYVPLALGPTTPTVPT
ncbi:unnamed protein product [Boreogadus saida]